jgi:flagellar biosynthetic protein FliO
MHFSRLTFSFLLLMLPVTSWAEEMASGGETPPKQAADFASSASLAAILFKVAGALILVVGIMIFLFIWLKKMGLTKGGLQQGSLVKLIDSKMIAPKKYVAVVQIGSDLLALGVSDQQITMLHHIENDTIKESVLEERAEKSAPFAGFLSKAAGRVKDTRQR